MKAMKFLRATLLAATVGLAGVSFAAPATAESVLRMQQTGDLAIIDPMMTTATPTRDMAYLVWDTLFAMDSNFVVHPQMVGDYSLSQDGTVYTFVLRDGLKWSDGTDVTAADCVASLNRWMSKDSLGKLLSERLVSLDATDDKTITLTLEQPWGLTLDVLGKPGAYVPFMMPERLATTDANTAITEFIGSGPFVMKVDEWMPGSKVVYVKNPLYVPRPEAADFLSGAKIAHFDRIERITFPDDVSAINALLTGDIDYMQAVPPDLIPLLEGNDNIRVYTRDPLGQSLQVVLNHTQKPFDDVRIRKAVQLALSPQEMMQAFFGDRTDRFVVCAAVFFCNTPLESDVGTQDVLVKDVEGAKALLAEAGYAGEPILVIHETDNQAGDVFATVIVQSLRAAGFTVDDFVTDTAGKFSRRANRGTLEEGGWHIFHTGWGGIDQMNPLTNVYALGACADGWFGWPCDETLQSLRQDYLNAGDQEARFAAAEAIQARMHEIVAFVPGGQYFETVAVNTAIEGLMDGPVYTYWNASRAEP